MALGVQYDDPRQTLEMVTVEERERAVAGKELDRAKLLASGQTWIVED